MTYTKFVNVDGHVPKIRDSSGSMKAQSYLSN